MVRVPDPTVTDAGCDVVSQSLTKRDKVVSLVFRDKTSDEVLSHKFLLLGIVRLIHADPNLMLNVRTVLMFTGFPRLLESPGFFFVKFPGPGKSWKMDLVLESAGNFTVRSWKVLEFFARL